MFNPDNMHHQPQRLPIFIILLGIPGGIFGMPPPLIIFYAMAARLPIPPIFYTYSAMPPPPCAPPPGIIFCICSIIPPMSPISPFCICCIMFMMLPMPPICWSMPGSIAFYNWFIIFFGSRFIYYTEITLITIRNSRGLIDILLTMLGSSIPCVILPMRSIIFEKRLCSPSRKRSSRGFEPAP